MKNFIHIDSNGFYLGSRISLNLDNRTGRWLAPGGCIDADLPEISEGMAARWNGNNWEYINDIRGEYYHTLTKEKLTVDYFITTADLSFCTKLVPGDYDLWNGEKWVFDYNKYAQAKSLELRAKCRNERKALFPDSLKDNLLVGFEYDDKNITLDNYRKLVKFYMDLVDTYEPLILAGKSMEEIDSVFNSIEFPKLDQILAQGGQA